MAYSQPQPTEDFYAILGLDSEAGAVEITKAYKKRALELHPDKNVGGKDTTADFQALGRAYDTLRDETKKRAYDAVYFSIKSRPLHTSSQTYSYPPPPNEHKREYPFDMSSEIERMRREARERYYREMTDMYARQETHRQYMREQHMREQRATEATADAKAAAETAHEQREIQEKLYQQYQEMRHRAQVLAERKRRLKEHKAALKQAAKELARQKAMKEEEMAAKAAELKGMRAKENEATARMIREIQRMRNTEGRKKRQSTESTVDSMRQEAVDFKTKADELQYDVETVQVELDKMRQQLVEHGGEPGKTAPDHVHFKRYFGTHDSSKTPSSTKTCWSPSYEQCTFIAPESDLFEDRAMAYQSRVDFTEAYFDEHP